MDEITYQMYLAMITGAPMPGEYVPQTNPMEVMTGDL